MGQEQKGGNNLDDERLHTKVEWKVFLIILLLQVLSSLLVHVELWLRFMEALLPNVKRVKLSV